MITNAWGEVAHHSKKRRDEGISWFLSPQFRDIAGALGQDQKVLMQIAYEILLAGPKKGKFLAQRASEKLAVRVHEDFSGVEI